MSNGDMRREIWDQNHQDLREQLKAMRLHANLSQIQLAEKLDTTQAFISKYERGERTLDFVEVLLVCNACECSVDKLVKKLKVK